MAASAQSSEKFSFRAFGTGLAVAALFYGAVAGWVALKSGETRQRIAESMPFLTLAIERAAPPVVMSQPEPYEAEIPSEAAETHEAPHAGMTHEPSTETREVVEIPSGPLTPAPLEGLYESVADGKLPKVSAAGLTPFDAYKRPFVHQGKPVIALAVKGYGLSAKDSNAALALPPEVTFILNPYAQDAELWQKKAREGGHEIWLQLPLENKRFLDEDPGPRALLANESLAENQGKLEWVLSRATGYAGIVAETDKVFLDMHSMLGALVTSVFKRGLGYLELNPRDSEFIETLSVAQNAPYAAIDKSFSIYNENRFAEIETTARSKGYGVLVLDLNPVNLEKARLWALSLEAKGFSMAPVSSIAAANLQEDRPQAGVSAARANHGGHAAPAPAADHGHHE